MERCLTCLYRYTPAAAFRLRVGMNEPSEETRRRVARVLESKTNVEGVHEWTPQIYKYPAMRRLFDDPPLTTDWVLWLDDDVLIDSADWLPRAAAVIDRSFDVTTESAPRGHRVFGRLFYMHPDADQWQWIARASWYRGRPPRMDAGHDPPLAKVDFVTGGFWLAPVAVMRDCDWPDPRIRHNGGDVMMGEALHQLGYGMAEVTKGVRLDVAQRRGFSEPACGKAAGMRAAQAPPSSAAGRVARLLGGLGQRFRGRRPHHPGPGSS